MALRESILPQHTNSVHQRERKRPVFHHLEKRGSTFLTKSFNINADRRGYGLHNLRGLLDRPRQLPARDNVRGVIAQGSECSVHSSRPRHPYRAHSRE